MKKRPPQKSTPNTAAQRDTRIGAPPAARTGGGHGWGPRWHAGRFRTALFLLVAAVGLVWVFGITGGPLSHWMLRDGYVATRATVTKAPFWADALDTRKDADEGVAGWYVEMTMRGLPYSVPVALGDFDPDRNQFDAKSPPDARRFAEGSVHPVWFYEDNHRKQPETVSLLQSSPVLVMSRAAFPRFPTFLEAVDSASELLVFPAILLALGFLFLLLSVWGKRGGSTAGSTFGARLVPFLFCLLVAGGAVMVNLDHPLAHRGEDFTAESIEIVRAPVASDRLTQFGGYRLLWRTWQVEARLNKPGSNVFLIDVDGIDPRRATWASRHSPEFAAFQLGNVLPVWRAGYQTTMLDTAGSYKPVLPWDAFLSRDRWPDKYTYQNFIADNPAAVRCIALALALALILIVPLGGRRVAS